MKKRKIVDVNVNKNIIKYVKLISAAKQSA